MLTTTNIYSTRIFRLTATAGTILVNSMNLTRPKICFLKLTTTFCFIKVSCLYIDLTHNRAEARFKLYSKKFEQIKKKPQQNWEPLVVSTLTTPLAPL